MCKRATELRNDGANTYGTISTLGLNVGDALMCNVNKDEKCYYNNTVEGVAKTRIYKTSKQILNESGDTTTPVKELNNCVF